MRKTVLRWLAAMLVIGLGAGAGLAKEPKVDAAVADFLGQARLDVLMRPDKVLSYRIDSQKETDEEGKNIGGLQVIAEGPELKDKQIKRMQGLIASEGNYNFMEAKLAMLEPDVALAFIKGDKRVDVMLCFSSDQWNFLMEGEWKLEDCDAAHNDLLALVKELFPEDDVIQGLAEQKK